MPRSPCGVFSLGAVLGGLLFAGVAVISHVYKLGYIAKFVGPTPYFPPIAAHPGKAAQPIWVTSGQDSIESWRASGHHTGISTETMEEPKAVDISSMPSRVGAKHQNNPTKHFSGIGAFSLGLVGVFLYFIFRKLLFNTRSHHDRRMAPTSSMNLVNDSELQQVVIEPHNISDMLVNWDPLASARGSSSDVPVHDMEANHGRVLISIFIAKGLQQSDATASSDLSDMMAHSIATRLRDFGVVSRCIYNPALNTPLSHSAGRRASLLTMSEANWLDFGIGRIQTGDSVIAEADVPEYGIFRPQTYQVQGIYFQGVGADGTVQRVDVKSMSAPAPPGCTGFSKYLVLYSESYHAESGPVVVRPDEVKLVTVQNEIVKSVPLALPGLFWVWLAYTFYQYGVDTGRI